MDSWSSLGRWWHHNPPPASREDIRPPSPPPLHGSFIIILSGGGGLPPREKGKRKKEVKPLLPFLLLLLLLPREEGEIYGRSEDATPGGSITRAYALIFSSFSFTCRKSLRSFHPDRRKRAFCRMWDAVCCASVGCVSAGDAAEAASTIQLGGSQCGSTVGERKNISLIRHSFPGKNPKSFKKQGFLYC